MVSCHQGPHFIRFSLFAFDGVQSIKGSQIDHSLTDGGGGIKCTRQLIFREYLSAVGINDCAESFNAEEVDFSIAGDQRGKNIDLSCVFFQSDSPFFRLTQVATPFWLTM